MSSIDDRLAELAKKLDTLTKRFDTFVENDVWSTTTTPLVFDTVCRYVESLRVDAQRWNEVYYHVFPERLRQDIKLEKQLYDLEHPPKPGDSKPKS